MIRVSVPGKIHLLGEHSVVFGKPALLSSISLKVHIALRRHSGKRNASRIVLGKDSGLSQNDNKKLQILKQVLERTIQKRFNIKRIPSYHIEINSELPIGSGLGSSAAISVGFTKALLKLLNIPENKTEVFEIALEGEKFFHGNPSGGDIAAVLNEGLTWFRKESEDIKIIQPIPFSVHRAVNNFFLIDSGKPTETTAEMIEKVRITYHMSHITTQKIFDDQEKLTKQLAQALKGGNSTLIHDCINKGEKNLEKLGVVGKKAKKIIRQIEKLGGAAKISGAGGVKAGSGMLLGYLISKKTLSELTKKNKWRVIPIRL